MDPETTLVDIDQDPPTENWLKHPRVDLDELLEFAETHEAEALDRLAGDRQLLLDLHLHAYSGASWNQFATALAEYGYQVIRSWLRNGRIFAKCAEKRIVVTNAPPELSLNAGDRKELTYDTVGIAISRFRDKVLVPNKWDPMKGASLKTFFIGQCLFQFALLHREWLRQRRDVPVSPRTVITLEGESLQQLPDRLIQLKRAWANLQPTDPGFLRAADQLGFTQAESAERLGMSVRAFESSIYRRRKRVRR